jgi:hypothetical protein
MRGACGGMGAMWGAAADDEAVDGAAMRGWQACPPGLAAGLPTSVPEAV